MMLTKADVNALRSEMNAQFGAHLRAIRSLRRWIVGTTIALGIVGFMVFLHAQ
jgi:hypothetical protein